ncbi:MAG: hypothetical protein WCE63_06430 [Acidobacteriaceae bacterium]
MSIKCRSYRYLPALFSMVAMLLALGNAQTALAQAPPDSLTAQPEGPNEIMLTWVTCQSSTQANCLEYYTIYRNPPSLDTLHDSRSFGSDSKVQYPDYHLTPSTKYTYMVCSDVKAKDGSNCLTVSTTTLAAPPPNSGSGGGSGKGSGNQGSTNETNTSAPPINLRVLAGVSLVSLKWDNPASPFPVVIDIARSLTGDRDFASSSPQKIVELNGNGDEKIPPVSYSDSGPFGPHFAYSYYVCTGIMDVIYRNCAHSNSVTLGGLDPILTAVRSNATTVGLSVVVDNVTTLAELKITRQDNSGPCGKGTTLGNGTQGCKTTSYANGVPINAPVITTIYDSKGPFSGPADSAPYTIAVANDTVTAGVEYYYQAQASWTGLGQDSQVVTVPASLTLHYLPSHKTFGTIPHGVKTVGVKSGTPGKVQGKVATTTQTAARTAALTPIRISAVAAAQAKVKANPNDAQSLYALGQSYCAVNLHDACVSTMYMGLLQSQKAGTTALTNQIKASLAAEGVTVNGVK